MNKLYVVMENTQGKYEASYHNICIVSKEEDAKEIVKQLEAISLYNKKFCVAFKNHLSTQKFSPPPIPDDINNECEYEKFSKANDEYHEKYTLVFEGFKELRYRPPFELQFKESVLKYIEDALYGVYDVCYKECEYLG